MMTTSEVNATTEKNRENMSTQREGAPVGPSGMNKELSGTERQERPVHMGNCTGNGIGPGRIREIQRMRFAYIPGQVQGEDREMQERQRWEGRLVHPKRPWRPASIFVFCP